MQSTSSHSAFVAKEGGKVALRRLKDIGEGANLRAGNAPLRLPEAYHSSATHFSPIILANQEKKASPSRVGLQSSFSGKGDRTSRNLKELKKHLLKQHSVQEGEAKLSPSDASSPPSNIHKSPPLIPSNAPEPHSVAIKSPTNNKFTPSKPSIVPCKDRGQASVPPVTQAVRPLPRRQGAQSTEGNNSSSSSSSPVNLVTSVHAPDTVQSLSAVAISQVGAHTSVHAANVVQPVLHRSTQASIQITDASHAIPAVTSAQLSQPLVVNGATISSPAMIPSYPSMPVIYQRDATGAVGWVPVMPNMPYWTISPQQVPAPQQVLPAQQLPATEQSPAANVISAVSQQPNTPLAAHLHSDVSNTPQIGSIAVSTPSATSDSSRSVLNTQSPHDGRDIGNSRREPVRDQVTTASGGEQVSSVRNNRTSLTNENDRERTTSNIRKETTTINVSSQVPITTFNGSQTTLSTTNSAQAATGEVTKARGMSRERSRERIPTGSKTESNGEQKTPLSRVSENSNSNDSTRKLMPATSKDEAVSSSAQTTITPRKSAKPRRSVSGDRGGRSKEQTGKQAHQKLLTLTKIRQLLKNEFAFDGYMNHGQEDVEMAEFIVSLHLPALDFTNWCNIIVAKYGDLYWSEELLVSLYEVIHGQKPDIDRPPSGALRAKSARVLSVDEPGSASTTQTVSQCFATSPFRPIPPSESSLGVFSASSTPRKSTSKRSLVKPRAMLPQVLQSEGGSVDVAITHSPLSFNLSRLKSASVTDLSRQLTPVTGGLTKSKSQTMLQTSMETRDMTPLVRSLVLPNGGTRQVMYIEGKQSNHQFDDIWTSSAVNNTSAFEQESDSHSHSSASELRVKGRLHNYSFPNSIGEEFADSAFGSRLSSEYESDNSLASHNHITSSQISVCSTIVYATYMTENKDLVSVLADKTENKSVDGVKKKIADLNQQISVNWKRRNKAYKYIKKICDSSQPKGTTDYKAMLAQVYVDYREAVTELDYLSHAKLQLEVLLAEQSSIDVACLFSFTKPSRPLLVIETKDNPRLSFHTQTDQKSGNEVEVLYAGEPYGLLSFLYAKAALEDGYILDFFHSYRYFLAAKDVMAFISEKYNAAKELSPSDIREKVMKRSLDLLTFWVSSYYSADLILSPTVVVTLINFLQDEVLSEHQIECEPLLKLLDEYENDKSKTSTFDNPLPANEVLPCYGDEESNPLHKRWNSTKTILTIGGGRSAVQYQRTGHGVSSYVIKSKKLTKDMSRSSTMSSLDAFSVTDYSPSVLAEQLTILDQLLFQDVHPVNFMNTLAQGIGASMVGSSAGMIPDQEKKPLFHSNYIQLVAVPEMIQHSKKLAHWVTAEVINTASAKAQTGMVNKFLQVAKICKDLRNFATCMSIKDGLDHPLIKYVPAWKEIPSKLIQELDDIKLLLKTESEAIKPPDDMLGLPTIPCALLFCLHVQQLEQGGFTLSNGMYRWPKLRSLARLVDLVRLCKTYTYKFTDNAELKELLQNKMSEMYTHNLEALAMTAGSDSGRGGAGNVSSRWSSVIKKVKGKFT